MLDDRSYMREPSYGSDRSLTITLIITLVVLFVIQSFIEHYTRFPLFYVFALSGYTLAKGWLWQLVTFQFLHAPLMHGGFWHILLNCWGIYMFGKPVEERLGSKRFLTLYLCSGVAGGLLHAIGNLLLPHNFGGVLGAPVVGASAGLFGLIAAYAALFPSRQLTLLLFFFLPVTLTARLLLIISAGLAVFGIVVPSDNIAHGAHLGGLLAGLAFIHWIYNADWQMPSLKFGRKQPKIFRPTKTVIVDEPLQEEGISDEVDAILDKISAKGIQSLTDREKKILEAARSKIAKR